MYWKWWRIIMQGRLYIVKFWMRGPPLGPIFFIFMQLPGNFNQIISWFTPPPRSAPGMLHRIIETHLQFSGCDLNLPNTHSPWYQNHRLWHTRFKWYITCRHQGRRSVGFYLLLFHHAISTSPAFCHSASLCRSMSGWNGWETSVTLNR